MKADLEKDIQKDILKFLWELKIFAWRNNSGMAFATTKGKSRAITFGAPGSPDIIAITSGLFVGVECKRPGKKQTDIQRAFQGNIEGAGGYYILATSRKDVEDGLTHISYGRRKQST